MNYKASCSQKTYTSNVFINGTNKKVSFYPVVKFWDSKINDNYFINEPQESKSKALTIAKNTIKNLDK